MGDGAVPKKTLVDPAIFERSATAILFVSLMLTIVLGAQLFPNLPNFDTDLSSFAPETDAEKAEARMSEHFPPESRPMFIHVVDDSGGNVLGIDNLHLQEAALQSIMNHSSSSQHYN